MISCPAAKQIRWVKPSIATVSPSRTRSATASCIETTFSVTSASAFRHPAGAGVQPSSGPRRTQSSLPSGSCITVQKLPSSSTRSMIVAPSSRSRATSAAIDPLGRKSMWTRFLTAFASGTGWKYSPSLTPAGSRTRAPSGSEPGASSDPSTSAQNHARRIGSAQSNVTVLIWTVTGTSVFGIRRRGGDDLLEDVQRHAGLVLPEHQRRRDPDRAVAGREPQEAALESCAFERGRRRVIGQVDADHQAQAPDLADRVLPALDVPEPVLQEVADLGRVLQEVLAFDHVDRGQRGGARDRVPAVRRAVGSRGPGHPLVAGDHRPERHPAGDPLPGQQDV